MHLHANAQAGELVRNFVFAQHARCLPDTELYTYPITDLSGLIDYLSRTTAKIAPDGGHYKSDEITRSPRTERANIGTGVGPRVSRPVSSLVAPLTKARLIDFLQIRYMPLDRLRAHPSLPYGNHPVGFQPPPMADLTGIPREGGDRTGHADTDMVRLGLPRFAD